MVFGGGGRVGLLTVCKKKDFGGFFVVLNKKG